MTRALAVFDAVTERVMLPLTLLGLVARPGSPRSPATTSWRGGAGRCPPRSSESWLVISIVRDLLKGQAGVDVIAVMAIGGALLLDESLTASVIAVMLATGDWLERYAEGRAHRELSALVSRAPRVVHRHEDGSIADRGIEDVEVGDRLLVKPGEVVPVDGNVHGRRSDPRRVRADR